MKPVRVSISILLAGISLPVFAHVGADGSAHHGFADLPQLLLHQLESFWALGAVGVAVTVLLWVLKDILGDDGEDRDG